MSDDRIQSERDFYRGQEYEPSPFAEAIGERAWVKRELEFWHRCTIEDYTATTVTVSLDNLDELTVPTACVRQFDLETGDVVFVRYLEWAPTGHPGFVREGVLGGYAGLVSRVNGETVEVNYPALFYRRAAQHYWHLLRDVRVYHDLESAIWPEGTWVFAYQARAFDPPLYLLFPGVAQEVYFDICVEVEFVDGETVFVPTTLVRPFEVHAGDIVYTCTSYVSHAISGDEQWGPCRVLSRAGTVVLLQDEAGERFESSLDMIAVLPRGYRMSDGKLEPQGSGSPDGAADPAMTPVMPGDVLLVRTEDWRRSADDPVTKAQLDELIATDAELAWSVGGAGDTPAAGPRYVSILWRGQPCFWWHGSEVRCARPNDEQLAKMIEMAVALDANVVREDGTEYH